MSSTTFEGYNAGDERDLVFEISRRETVINHLKSHLG